MRSMAVKETCSCGATFETAGTAAYEERMVHLFRLEHRCKDSDEQE